MAPSDLVEGVRVLALDRLPVLLVALDVVGRAVRRPERDHRLHVGHGGLGAARRVVTSAGMGPPQNTGACAGRGDGGASGTSENVGPPAHRFGRARDHRSRISGRSRSDTDDRPAGSESDSAVRDRPPSGTALTRVLPSPASWPRRCSRRCGTRTRSRAAVRADAALHRPASHSRGDEPAGVRDAAATRAEGRASRSGRSPRSTTSSRPTARRGRSPTAGRGDDVGHREELPRVRHHAARPRQPAGRGSSTSSAPNRDSRSRA